MYSFYASVWYNNFSQLKKLLHIQRYHMCQYISPYKWISILFSFYASIWYNNFDQLKKLLHIQRYKMRQYISSCKWISKACRFWIGKRG
jgi:hypothetical protein